MTWSYLRGRAYPTRLIISSASTHPKGSGPGTEAQARLRVYVHRPPFLGHRLPCGHRRACAGGAGLLGSAWVVAGGVIRLHLSHLRSSAVHGRSSRSRRPPPEACLSYDRRMRDQEAGGVSVTKRVVSVSAVLIGDLLLLLMAGWVKSSVHLRGELCDGASVWCDGRGDPTPTEWLAEMNFRSAAAYTLSAAVALILLVVAAVAWRHRRRDIALVQVFPLLLVAAFVITWTPYTPV
jgi:hypothetical protein